MQTNRRTTAFSLLFLLLNKLFAHKRRSHLCLQQNDEMCLILPTLSASARAIAETLIRFHYPVDFIVLASNSAFWRRSAFCNLIGHLYKTITPSVSLFWNRTKRPTIFPSAWSFYSSKIDWDSSFRSSVWRHPQKTLMIKGHRNFWGWGSLKNENLKRMFLAYLSG